MKVYVVHMQRWGDPECHSYILGTYTKKGFAQAAGNKEKEWRANKYEPHIVAVELDYDPLTVCPDCDSVNKKGYIDVNCQCKGF